MSATDKNIFPQRLKVNRQQREDNNNQQSFTLWLTGLSAAGKSTIATGVDLWFFENGYRSYVLDGDNTRLGINKDLSYSDDDRKENIRRVAEISRLFNDAGIIVIAAYISPFEEDRLKAKNTIGKNDFIEIHVDASIETCKTRDQKGLYTKAEKGEIKNFTGISSRYEPPVSPDIHINTDKNDEKESIQIVINYLRQTGKL